ncbi:MAG: hypothetical protein IPG87_00525 [Saprospiraceae bacterium]|nr:hypothetical protein [Candidatus Vicinibacter affinis]MBK7303224.1 hypothetical protein [Candidatus Vicinibacter affinis]MBK7695078.1 hypothetical protein [Candidatus Vicinibacter affinis]
MISFVRALQLGYTTIEKIGAAPSAFDCLFFLLPVSAPEQYYMQMRNYFIMYINGLRPYTYTGMRNY